MKKIFVLMILFNFIFVLFVFSQEKTSIKTIDKIDSEVERKMEQIKNFGKTGPFVEEIKIKKGVKKEEIKKEIIPDKSGYIGILATLNIVGGIFEGGIIGAGCGLIGYAQLDNKNSSPLVNGAIIGAGAGAALASVLSIVQLNTRKYILSDYFGLNTMGGAILGSLIGAAGGAISFGRTNRMEDVTLGIGYGVLFGSVSGLILAIVEFILPEDLIGGAGYYWDSERAVKRAMNIIIDKEYAMMNFNF